MRFSLVGALVMAGLAVAVMAGRSFSELAYGPQGNGSSYAMSAELITHVAAADGQPQVVTVVDPRHRVMAIYHVDRATGEITPKSVRNLTWDLQMIDYNSGKPLPQDIRSGLQH